MSEPHFTLVPDSIFHAGWLSSVLGMDRPDWSDDPAALCGWETAESCKGSAYPALNRLQEALAAMIVAGNFTLRSRAYETTRKRLRREQELREAQARVDARRQTE